MNVVDFRENVYVGGETAGMHRHLSQAGDPGGYHCVRLGSDSFLADVDEFSKNFRVTKYDPQVMNAHHAAGHHEYLIAGTVLNSDVVINLPKLKTHRKAGLTCCLKNIVGINGSKDYLPHHRVGAPVDGGDEYPSRCLWKKLGSKLYDAIESHPGRGTNRVRFALLRACRRLARLNNADPHYEGSWHGNDTIWRTVLDLNHLLTFARKDGTVAPSPQRQIFNIVDAAIVGGGEGPLRPDPVNAGLVLAGRESALVDAFAARLVGFDPEKIPTIRHGLAHLPADAVAGRLVSGARAYDRLALCDIMPVVRIGPPAGWKGNVELTA